jgi:hypothetical protein
MGDVVGMMRSFQRISEALISHLDRDEARVLTPPEGPPHALVGTGSIHCELEKVKFPEFFGAPDDITAEAWLENMAMCFALRDYTSNMKVCMEVFQLKGSTLLWWKTLLPQLNMVIEDMSWELFEERFRERYLSEEFIECQLNEFNALRQGGHTVPEYEACFMELLRYAPHLNTEKLKVNRFLFGLNVSIREKVRILMPQTLHDVIQKTLIVEEELINRGQRRTPVRLVGKVSSGVQHHHTPARHTPWDIVASREDPLSLHLDDQHLNSRLLTKDHKYINNNVDCSSNNLGLFSRTDQDSRLVGHQLLLRVPGVLDRRRGVGHVGSHTTNATVQWRGLEHLDQPDPLSWEIWARPIRFMEQSITAR